MRVYCEDCYYYDYECYFGTDCTHSNNKKILLVGSWLKREDRYMWQCWKKNKNNDCELYLSKKAKCDRKCIFKWIGRKLRGK